MYQTTRSSDQCPEAGPVGRERGVEVAEVDSTRGRNLGDAAVYTSVGGGRSLVGNGGLLCLM